MSWRRAAAAPLSRISSTALEQEEWERRHRGVVGLLLVQVVAVLAWSVWAGHGLLHVLGHASGLLVCTVLAVWPGGDRRLRGLAGAVGLMTVSALVVHLAHGATVAHFHFFVMVAVIARYEDLLAFTAGVGFVVVEHGVLGTMAPHAVFNGSDARHPWAWAAVHGGAVLAAAAAHVSTWRANEDVRRRLMEEHERALGAQDAAAAAARLLADVLTQAPDAFLSVGADEHILDWNASATALFGWSREEAVGARLSELLVPEEHRAAHCRGFGRVVSTGRLTLHRAFELDVLRPDGSTVPIELTLGIVGSGADLRVNAFARDLRERRAREAERAEAEARLGEANRRFAQAVEHAPIGMALLDLEGRWTEVNRALCALLGYSQERLLQLSFQDITHPDDLDADLALVDDLLAGRRTSYEIEKRYVRQDGSQAWVLLTKSLLRDGQGAPLHFITQVLDVSERKEAEAQLRARADVDPLTGALTRRRFDEVLRAAVGRAQRYGDSSALLYMDLDGFKAINDLHGHHVGDQLLRRVASSVAARLRVSDVLGRQGGDEFVVLLDGIGQADADAVAEELARLVASAAVVTEQGTAVSVGVSIGVTMLDGEHPMTPDDALRAADEAMYVVKGRLPGRLAVPAAPG